MTGLLRVFFAASVVLSPAASFADELLPAESSIPEVIDHYVARLLKLDDVQPAKPADAANLVRRLTLDLAGRIPSTAEARAYVESGDENKRTALMCGLVFLGLNGERLQADPDELHALVDGVARGDVDKAETSVFFRRHCVSQ